MWTLNKTETVSGGTLLFFTKAQMERNTVILGTATESQIQELITQWELEDAAVTQEGN